MYYVYILKSQKDSHLYTGFTSNLKLRFLEHQKGLVKSTKNRRPLKLVYYQAFLSKKDALEEETYLKSGGSAKNKLALRIKNSLILIK
ncbi:GIY-YIG nuclease family protein [Patescibacteria group bacterium]|nr:GIY-YIG nuclease family protein [Patescibacteria group bacterium]